MADAARRLAECVNMWPDAHTGGYDPRCCRFPKSCSATVYDPAGVAAIDLEPAIEAPASAVMADKIINGDVDLVAQAMHEALRGPLTCLAAEDYERAATAVLGALAGAERLRSDGDGYWVPGAGLEIRLREAYVSACAEMGQLVEGHARWYMRAGAVEAMAGLAGRLGIELPACIEPRP